MKRVLIFVLFSLACCVGQVNPIFKGHQIGETAQQFFSKALMAGKDGVLTIDYCNAYLSDPKTMKAYEKAQRKSDVKAMSASVDVKGCQDVQAAMHGKDADIDGRYANEFPMGDVSFRSGKLVRISFSLETAAYEDVVADMTRKLGAEPKQGERSSQNATGGMLVERDSTWTLDNLVARADEQKDSHGSHGVTLIIADRVFLEHSRPNTLD
jgi:hypothetical protein